MPLAIKTIGPLHLEDMEPHRFEDLIRQLLYDFKTWIKIEATGRSGGDDGFDVRAWELDTRAPPDDQDQDDGDTGLLGAPGRQWLVQCKRERSIGPKKLIGYLDQISVEERREIYGVIFVGACDF